MVDRRDDPSVRSAFGQLILLRGTSLILLLYHAGGRGLGPKAAAVFQAAEARKAVIYVPAAVVWEVTLLARAGKINLRRTPRVFFVGIAATHA